MALVGQLKDVGEVARVILVADANRALDRVAVEHVIDIRQQAVFRCFKTDSDIRGSEGWNKPHIILVSGAIAGVAHVAFREEVSAVSDRDIESRGSGNGMLGSPL